MTTPSNRTVISPSRFQAPAPTPSVCCPFDVPPPEPTSSHAFSVGEVGGYQFGEPTGQASSSQSFKVGEAAGFQFGVPAGQDSSSQSFNVGEAGGFQFGVPAGQASSRQLGLCGPSDSRPITPVGVGGVIKCAPPLVVCTVRLL